MLERSVLADALQGFHCCGAEVARFRWAGRGLNGSRFLAAGSVRVLPLPAPAAQLIWLLRLPSWQVLSWHLDGCDLKVRGAQSEVETWSDVPLCEGCRSSCAVCHRAEVGPSGWFVS